MAIEGYFQFERAISLYNSFFLFPVATALYIVGIVSTNRRSAANFGQSDETSFLLRIQDEHSQRRWYRRGRVYILNRHGGSNLQDEYSNIGGFTWHRPVKKETDCL